MRELTKKILIGNITSDTTEEILREMLGEVSAVLKLQINKGYAIVELPNELSADLVVSKLHGQALNGRTLSISIDEGEAPKRKWYQFGK